VSKPFATGGCQCGAVRYALMKEPHGSDLCHCRMCQRATGNLFGAFADCKVEDVVWMRGRPRFFASSNLIERGFCEVCGTPLTYGLRNGGDVSVTIGSLDDPARVPARVHFGVESRVPWVRINDELPQRRTGDSAAAAEFLKDLVSLQSPEGAA